MRRILFPLLLTVGCRYAPTDKDVVPVDTTDSSDTSPIDTAMSRPTGVIVILSDDQGENTMWAMPSVTERLLPQSVVFSSAYVTVPMCCPMRASLYSGGWYPRDTGVITNTEPTGGATHFTDTDTLGTRLQAAGVATAMIGKYLNEYEYDLAPYVPPGWTTWVAQGQGDGGYASQVIEGSSTTTSTTGVIGGTDGQHLTPYLFGRALEFIDAHPDEPYFVIIAPLSPHLGGRPETQDEGLYADYEPRPAAWNEEDTSDKPAWIRERPQLTEEVAARYDENARSMLRNLTSVDRSVMEFVDALDARGVLDDTVVIYTSDNGYLNGEHRLSMKGLPYEESVHIPLIVRYPGVAPREDERLVQGNTDLAATVLDLLGAEATGEGLSLATAFTDPSAATRDHVYIENYAEGFPVWAGVVTDRYKFVQWGTGDDELYDLDADPWELQSLHAALPADADRPAWNAWIDEHRGLALTTTDVPPGDVGVAYDYQLRSWGGTEPVRYTVEDSELPPGLEMSLAGRITGTPTTAGSFVFSGWARDASVSPWNGGERAYNAGFQMVIGEPAEREAVSRSTPTSARLVLTARPGVAVRVRAATDPALDGPRRLSEVVIAGADGRAVVTLEDLSPDRDWYWVASFNGVPGARGEIPHAR